MSAIGFDGNMDYRIKSGNDDREAVPVSALIPFERKMLSHVRIFQMWAK
jgi:hypothetical protein